MKRFLLALMLLMPMTLHAKEWADEDDFNRPLQKFDQDDNREVLGIVSLVATVPLLVLATHTTYDRGQGLCIGAATVCATNGAICLVKF